MLSTAKLVKDEKPEICITHNWLEDSIKYPRKCTEQQGQLQTLTAKYHSHVMLGDDCVEASMTVKLINSAKAAI